MTCDCSFTEAREFKTHRDSIHEGKRPFKCEICDINLKWKSEKVVIYLSSSKLLLLDFQSLLPIKHIMSTDCCNDRLLA